MENGREDWSQFDLSREEMDKLVAEVMRYVLFRTQQNSGCPIKREDITQLVTKTYRHRNLPAVVITEAREKLSTIFGYEMRELHRTRASSANQGRSSQQITSVGDAKSYVIVSRLPPDIYKKYVEDTSTAPLTGFTFVIISIVHLAGGKIPEENLWRHMRRLGLNESDENHPDVGNVKDTLELLVQQRYLQKDKVQGPEGNTMFYELAERALDGHILERIKEYIPEIVKNDEDDDDDDADDAD